MLVPHGTKVLDAPTPCVQQSHRQFEKCLRYLLDYRRNLCLCGRLFQPVPLFNAYATFLLNNPSANAQKSLNSSNLVAAPPKNFSQQCVSPLKLLMAMSFAC